MGRGAQAPCVIEARGLTRLFGSTTACADITLSVPAGGVFSLLGCNGAGKSTFVKMVIGLLSPTAGMVRVLGGAPGELEVRRRLGFLPEHFRYPEWATGREVCEFHAALAGVAVERRRGRIADVLERVGLASVGRRPVGAYSKGMQQRLGLAVALVGDPELVVLDEPTSALDPLGRREVRGLLQQLRDEGRTVFLNSHLLSEVEMVSDRVAVIRDGRLAAAGTLPELLAAGLEAEVSLGAGDQAGLAAVERWAAAAEGRDVLGRDAAAGGQVRVRVALGEAEDPPELAAAVVQGGGRLYGLRVRSRTLEDVFVDLVTADGGARPA